ncbi:spore coat protein B [Bacillus thuringiensis]
MNMKKAIIIIASTVITLYTIKNRKKRNNENVLYYPYTLLEKK